MIAPVSVSVSVFRVNRIKQICYILAKIAAQQHFSSRPSLRKQIFRPYLVKSSFRISVQYSTRLSRFFISMSFLIFTLPGHKMPWFWVIFSGQNCQLRPFSRCLYIFKKNSRYFFQHFSSNFEFKMCIFQIFIIKISLKPLKVVISNIFKFFRPLKLTHHILVVRVFDGFLNIRIRFLFRSGMPIVWQIFRTSCPRPGHPLDSASRYTCLASESSGKDLILFTTSSMTTCFVVNQIYLWYWNNNSFISCDAKVFTSFNYNCFVLS